MAAADHLQPRQLSMFMTPHEIVTTHDLADLLPHENPRQLIERKNRENARFGAPDLGRPVSIDHDSADEGDRPLFGDGHHRLAAAYKRDPHVLMPVEHMDRRNWDSLT